MATYAGGTQVKSGYYIDARSFRFQNVEKDGQALPGAAETRWVRIPTVAVMAAAPALGGLFVVMLPLLGFGMAAYAVAKRLGVGVKEVAATVAAPAVPAGQTALTGQPAAKEGPAAAPAGEKDALAKEIEEKRAQK